MNKRKIYAADLFCGAGGTSQGLLMAANKIKADLQLMAINHWQIAIDTHTLNHPGAENLCTGVDVVNPLELVPRGRLDILCASPECTHHSVARGGRPMNDQSRSSAWHILRWAQVLYIDNLIIENVPEFQSWGPLGANGRPMKSKRGELFQLFIQNLKGLGYRVEYRVLNCADYGAPTTRRRLFMIARRGNKKIVWPEPTHVRPAAKDTALLFAEDRPKWRTAREIIDWSLPSKDIFDRKKPLAPNTLRRIQAGLKKFNGIHLDLKKCFEKGLRPYIVVMRGTSTAQSVDDPLHTVTGGGNNYGLVQPFLSHFRGNHSGREDGDSRNSDLNNPLPTQDTSNRFGIVQPFLLGHPRSKDGECCTPTHSVDKPLNTITASSSDFSICEPLMMEIGQASGNGSLRTVNYPIATLVTKENTAVVEPFPVLLRKGQGARDVDEPLATLTTKGANYGVAEPFIVPQFSGAEPRSVDRPAGTVTTTSRGVGVAQAFLTTAGGTEGQGRTPHSVDHPLGAVLTNDRRALCEPFLATVTHQGGDRVNSVDEPMATVTSSMGEGITEPYLVEYYGMGQPGSVDDPLSTVTCRDRNALILPRLVADGHRVYRLEIRFRMLQPRELARAQGFPDTYEFTGNREAVVKQIGNAVCPPMAEALCLAVMQ